MTAAVGTVADRPRTGSEYSELSRQIKEAGLLRRRPGYYAAKMTATALAYVGGWVAVFAIGESWLQLGMAVISALILTHVAFLGHDVGHRQVFTSRRKSEMFGYIAGNLGIGMSQGWWTDKHNRHHAHPNQLGHDPDVADGVIAWTAEQAAGRRGFAGWLARWQGVLFFPMLLLEGLNLHVTSVRALGERPKNRRLLEGALLFGHFGGSIALAFLAMSPLQAVAFLVIQQALWGVYMGASFAPNHKGMPVLAEDDKMDFLRRQVITSRNVKGSPFTDFALGGLNYQIEHHLFPNMPRPALRKAQPIVQAFCDQRGIPYLQTGLIESYRQSLGHLDDVAH